MFVSVRFIDIAVMILRTKLFTPNLSRQCND